MRVLAKSIFRDGVVVDSQQFHSRAILRESFLECKVGRFGDEGRFMASVLKEGGSSCP